MFWTRSRLQTSHDRPGNGFCSKPRCCQHLSSFATPQEVGDAIIKAGFDVVESATNHADDYGYDYLKSTLDFWSTNYPDIPVLGIHATQEDADTVKVKEVNGIKIAFLTIHTAPIIPVQAKDMST